MSRSRTFSSHSRGARDFVSPDRRSELYESALTAIRALAEAEGTDLATRAYAEATWDLDRDGYAASRKLKLANGPVCIQRIHGKRCREFSSYGTRCECHPPADDHPSLWNKERKPERYLSQPYSLSTEDLRQVVAFVDRFDLDVVVTPWPSFHFPGSILSVEYRRRDGEPGYLNDYGHKTSTKIAEIRDEEHIEMSSGPVAIFGREYSKTTWARREGTEKAMPPYVKLFKSGDHLAVQTNCTSEHEFVSQFTAALAVVQPTEKGQRWLEALRGWIPQGFEILAKLRGYKSDVQEERVLLAGNPPVTLESLIADSSETVYELPALHGDAIEGPPEE